MGLGRGWDHNFVAQYGAENVEWTAGSGRTIEWRPELPVPEGSMFRVRSPEVRSPQFISELESVAGPRPEDAIGHHVKPLMCGGADCGTTNGAWVQRPEHVGGHNAIKSIERLPLGTEIVVKPSS